MSAVTQSTYIFRQFIKRLKKKILTLVMVVLLVPRMFYSCRRDRMVMRNAHNLKLIRILRNNED